MAEGGNKLSRNPNVCASCSSMLDGMNDSAEPPASPGSKPPEAEPAVTASPAGEMLIVHQNR
jgi:hypothetical protein